MLLSGCVFSLYNMVLHKFSLSEPIRSFNLYNDKLLYERVETGEIVIADMDGGNPEKICIGSVPIVLNNKLLSLLKKRNSLCHRAVT